jgi:hypothetical protein
MISHPITLITEGLRIKRCPSKGFTYGQSSTDWIEMISVLSQVVLCQEPELQKRKSGVQGSAQGFKSSHSGD